MQPNQDNNQNNGAQTPSVVPPVVQLPVQAAEHSEVMPDHQENDTEKKGSKLLLVLILLVVLVVLGVLGYFLLTQRAPDTETQMEERSTVVSEPTSTVAPTPKDEAEETDLIDVTYPETEVDAVQTDLQVL